MCIRDSYRFAALKNIVDKDLNFPAFQAYEEQLKSGWKYETTRYTEMTPHLHLLKFFEEYRVHNDFKKAIGDGRSARYAALLTITKKADEECNELERELKALWERFIESRVIHSETKRGRGVHFNRANRTRCLNLVTRPSLVFSRQFIPG